MSGDWIKMRSDLFTHPKVVRISSAMKADSLRTVGGLMSVWCLFDAHSVDGVLEGYTSETVDNHVRWPGFSAAMEAVGWLISEESCLKLPRFDAHNGQSAKKRAQDADRKREAREAERLSALEADKERTREEKRREDIKDPLVDSQSTEGKVVPIRPDLPDCPHQEILALYHEILPTLTQMRRWEGSRSKQLLSRWRENPKHQNLDYWRGYFEYVSQSDFLMGRKTAWRADLEWLTKASNFTKVIEGKYENEEAQQ